MGKAVGIDLGTTHSLVAQVQDGVPVCIPDERLRVLLPSVVHYDPSGHFKAVGYEARGLMADAPERTISSVKRLIGRAPRDLSSSVRADLPWPLESDERVARIRVGDQIVTPPQVSAEILKHLRSRAERALGQAIHEIVLTVPSYFDDAQRQATKDAGRLAGLDVLRLINEPTAAALAYGLQQLGDGTVAVYDLGGGTFDISILHLKGGIFEVAATCGDTALGGDDFDRQLAKLLLTKEPRLGELSSSLLKQYAELAKRRLSSKSELTLTIPLGEDDSVELHITRSAFEDAIRELVERTGVPCRQAMQDAGIGPTDLDEVILVGGSTRTPLVRSYLEELFGQEPLCSLDPDEVVALGAAVQADILTGGTSSDILLLDVCSLSIGIETMGGNVSKLIHRNSTIPTSASESYTTYVDDQNAVIIHVVQGEREMASDNRSLARFELEIPPMPAGLPLVEVSFLINPDGILEVIAHERRSDEQMAVTVEPSYGLDDAEVERMLEASLEHAAEDIERRQLSEAVIDAEQVLLAVKRAFESDDELLEAGEEQPIRQATDKLELALQGTDRVAILAALDELNHTTEAWADRRMNRSILDMLGGTSADGSDSQASSEG